MRTGHQGARTSPPDDLSYFLTAAKGGPGSIVGQLESTRYFDLDDQGQNPVVYIYYRI
jgi:hypothetical protein